MGVIMWIISALVLFLFCFPLKGKGKKSIAGVRLNRAEISRSLVLFTFLWSYIYFVFNC